MVDEGIFLGFQFFSPIQLFKDTCTVGLIRRNNVYCVTLRYAKFTLPYTLYILYMRMREVQIWAATGHWSFYSVKMKSNRLNHMDILDIMSVLSLCMHTIISSCLMPASSLSSECSSAGTATYLLTASRKCERCYKKAAPTLDCSWVFVAFLRPWGFIYCISVDT